MFSLPQSPPILYHLLPLSPLTGPPPFLPLPTPFYRHLYLPLPAPPQPPSFYCPLYHPLLAPPLQITQVTEFARDVYSETGATLLETIATRHPCIISDIVNRAKVTVGTSPEVSGCRGSTTIAITKVYYMNC